MELDFTTLGNQLPFKIFDHNTNRVWSVVCFTRQTGRYTKPVISGQWARFVQANNLQIGDLLRFYKNPDLNSDVPFIVDFVRIAP